MAPLGLDSNDVVRQRSRHVDELGHEHVRFERSYRGLPVKGGDFVVHTQAREDETFSAMIAAAIPVSQRPSDPAQAQRRQADLGHRADRDGRTRSWLSTRSAKPKTSCSPTKSSRRASKTDGTPSVMHTFVDANGGRHLTLVTKSKTGAATGSGRGINNGSVSLNTNLNGSA